MLPKIGDEATCIQRKPETLSTEHHLSCERSPFIFLYISAAVLPMCDWYLLCLQFLPQILNKRKLINKCTFRVWNYLITRKSLRFSVLRLLTLFAQKKVVDFIILKLIWILPILRCIKHPPRPLPKKGFPFSLCVSRIWRGYVRWWRRSDCDRFLAWKKELGPGRY